MSIVEEKQKNSTKSQQQFEKETQAWHDAIKSKTEKMAQARRKSWNGKIADAPAPKLEEGTKVKKEKK